jgi:hypothetical protein
MESLNNYIVERIRIDNVKHVKHSEFPVDGTVEEIVDFLKEQGFKEINDPHSGFSDSAKFLNDMKGKCFSVDTRGWEVLGVEFADTSTNKISEDNPFYYIDMSVKARKNGFPFTRFIGGQTTSNIFHLSPREFKTEMELYF